MPGNVIAEGQVRLDADVSAAEAGLAKLRADFERSMAAIDRASAEAKVSADTTDLDAKIADVKRKLLELDKATADPKIDIDETEALAEIAALKAALKELNQQKTEINVNSKQLRDANKERAISAQRQAEMARQYEKEARTSEKAAQARAKGEQLVQRELQKRGQLEARAYRDNERFNRSGLEQAATLAKLREGYAKLSAEETKLSSKTGRPGGIFRTDTENRALERTRSEMALTEHKIRELGGAVDDINPSLEKNQNVLGRWANSLGGVRVQMGFFSSTLRQAAVGAIALGPVITGLIGTATSLVGVIGTGAAGAFTVASAAISGFGLSALGLGLVLKPAISEFKEAETVTKAYDKAVKEYGKDSTQAKSAQEKMNGMLASLDPVARKAVKSLSTISDRWSQLTQGTRKPIFNAIAEGVKTVQALMPTFARDTVGSVKAISGAWSGWLKSLRSQEAKQLLNTVMTNFKKSIPGIASGFASIGAAFGRITASASKFLPSLTKGFSGWANEIESAIGGGNSLDSSIGRLIGHMQDLGHLGQATGSLLVHLFNTSADSGDDLVKTLTNVFGKWDDWVQSTHGQNSLKDFFSESVDESKELGSVVGGVVRILFQIGRAAAPISQGFLHVLTIIGNIVTAASSLNGLDFALKGIGATLAGIWAINKVKSFVGAVQGATGAVRALMATMAGGSLAEGAAGGSGGLLSRLLGTGGSSKAAASELRSIEGAAAESSGAFAGAEASATGLGAALGGPLVIGAAAALIGIVAIAEATPPVLTHFQQVQQAARNAGEAFHKASGEFVEGSEDYNNAIHKHVKASNQLKEAEKKQLAIQENKKSTPGEEAKATEDVNRAEEKLATTQVQAGHQRTMNAHAAEVALHTKKQQVKAIEEEIKLQKNAAPGGQGKGGIGNDANRLAAAENNLAAARRGAAHAAHEFMLANIPLERQQHGLAPLTDKTTAALRKMSDTIGTAATKKIGNFIKPGDVQQVANLSNRLTKLGQGKQVKNIDVKSQGADQTISKLQRLQKQTNNVGKGVTQLTVKSNDSQANASLRRVAALAQNLVGSKPVLRILGNASDAEAALARLKAKVENAVHHQYQAEVKGIDRTGPAVSSADHHLRDVANKKAEAKITALDKTISGVSAAKAALQAAANHPYQAKITAVNQTAAGISSAEASLNALSEHSVTIPIYGQYSGTKGSPPGHATGGPSTYSATTSVMNTLVRPGGRSQKIARPTMLTGEEGSKHPEYVIATNPAYRDSNARYLKEAADALGYIAVPGYKKGKGGGNNNGHKGNNGGGNNDPASSKSNPGPKPKAWKHKPAWYIKHDTFAPGAVHNINADEKQLEQIEHEYNAELEKEERLIQQGQLDKWNFGLFKNKRESAKSINLDIIHQDTVVENLAGKAKENAEAIFGPEGSRSPNKLDAKEKNAKALANEASNYSETPPGGKKKGESEKTYNEKKKQRREVKHEKEKAASAAAAELKKWKEEAKHAEEIYKQANSELEEVHHQREETRITNSEVQNNLNELDYIEKNPTAAPYYEEPEKLPGEENITPFELAEQRVEEAELAGGALPSEGAKQLILQRRQEALGYAQQEMQTAATTVGNKDDQEAFGDYKTAKEALEGAGSEGGSSDKPTVGEETASFNSARQTLYQQFASNITPSSPVSSALSAAKAFSSSLKVPITAAVQAGISQGAGNVDSMSSGPTVNNYFSTPPPDPHTWSKNVLFELNA